MCHRKSCSRSPSPYVRRSILDASKPRVVAVPPPWMVPQPVKAEPPPAPDPPAKARVCLRCGHPPCPHCVTWCDNMDPNHVTTLCCGGLCTYPGDPGAELLEDEIPGLLPGHEAMRTHGGHAFKITATAEVGTQSGRRRYRVECITCDMIVHPGSTSAQSQMDYHLRYPMD